MKDLTSDRPKVMLEIDKKPILEKIIKGLKDNGIEEIILVVNYKKEKIIDYFGDGSDLGVKIKYAVQKEPLGTADALRYVESHIDENYFLLIYGDQLFDFNIISELKNCSRPMICITKVKNPEEFGIIEIKNDKVIKILEKVKNPSSNLINTGIYILPKKIFKEIKNTKKSKRGEYELTDSIQSLMNKGMSFGYLKIENWLSIGTKEDYLNLINHLSQ